MTNNGIICIPFLNYYKPFTIFRTFNHTSLAYSEYLKKNFFFEHTKSPKSIIDFKRKQKEKTLFDETDGVQSVLNKL